METEGRLVFARGWGRGGWSVTIKGSEVALWGDEMFWN